MKTTKPNVLIESLSVKDDKKAQRTYIIMSTVLILIFFALGIAGLIVINIEPLPLAKTILGYAAIIGILIFPFIIIKIDRTNRFISENLANKCLSLKPDTYGTILRTASYMTSRGEVNGVAVNRRNTYIVLDIDGVEYDALTLDASINEVNVEIGKSIPLYTVDFYKFGYGGKHKYFAYRKDVFK